MSLTLERLLFDRAAVADGPQVGAHLLGTGSAAISSTDVSGDEALNVYFLNASFPITATDLDIRDLTSATDSVEIKTAAGVALAIDASGFVTANINGTVTISDLVYTSDSVTAHQGGTWSNQITDGVETLAINADGSINVNLTDDSIADGAADAGNPFKVGGRAYSTATALTAVDSGDRVDLLTDLYRRVFINNASNVSVASQIVTVGATAVALPQLAGRNRIVLQNRSDKPIYVGPSGVTTASGLMIDKGATWTDQIGEAVALYAISSAAGKSLCVLELA